jgi:DUF438 domain-containing protein
VYKYFVLMIISLAAMSFAAGGEITQLLTRLIAGDDPEIVRQESKKCLAVIGLRDIALAEQKLLELGVGVSDFRGLCTVHMEAFKDQRPQNLLALPANHVLNTVLSEHKMILCFVNGKQYFTIA